MIDDKDGVLKFKACDCWVWRSEVKQVAGLRLLYRRSSCMQSGNDSAGDKWAR
jgi:hypothetical protein